MSGCFGGRVQGRAENTVRIVNAATATMSHVRSLHVPHCAAQKSKRCIEVAHSAKEVSRIEGQQAASTHKVAAAAPPQYTHLKHDAAHVLLCHDTLLGGPLEGGHAGVLDLIEVLHSLGDIHQDVGASGVGAKAPDLLCQLLVPAILGAHGGGADLCVECVTEDIE